jgi:hypothetical protein
MPVGKSFYAPMSLITNVTVTLTAVIVAAHQAVPRAPVTQSVDLLVPFAPVTFNQAGSTQLVYELHVTNFLAADASLTGVRITDADGRTLAEYRDSELRRRIVRPGLGRTHATPQVIGSGARAVVNFWIALPAVSPRPSSIRHAVELEVLRPTGAVRSVVEDARSPVSSPTAVALGPPLRGGPWVAIYDPLLMGGHRTAIYTVDGRARIPGRFAIDFIALPPGGALVRAPAVRPDNWNGFGSDVLAVADGTVAAAVDDTPDDTPKPVALEYASGNYVAIDLGDGRFAFYEHLQRGSVAVATGRRVRRGEVIAKLGSSGSTSIGPHLHFHVANTNSLLAAEGLPFVFSDFVQSGGFASIDALVNGELPSMTDGERRATMQRPAPNAIVRFR